MGFKNFFLTIPMVFMRLLLSSTLYLENFFSNTIENITNNNVQILFCLFFSLQRYYVGYVWLSFLSNFRFVQLPPLKNHEQNGIITSRFAPIFCFKNVKFAFFHTFSGNLGAYLEYYSDCSEGEHPSSRGARHLRHARVSDDKS